MNHHVARFVYWGKGAEYLLSSQPWNYAFGAGSALERFLLLDGKIVLIWREMEEFDTSGDGAHANWPDRFFAKTVDSLLVKSGNTGGLVGNAMTHLLALAARALLDYAHPWMKAVAAEPRAADSLIEKEWSGRS